MSTGQLNSRNTELYSSFMWLRKSSNLCKICNHCLSCFFLFLIVTTVVKISCKCLKKKKNCTPLIQSNMYSYFWFISFSTVNFSSIYWFVLFHVISAAIYKSFIAEIRPQKRIYSLSIERHTFQRVQVIVIKYYFTPLPTRAKYTQQATRPFSVTGVHFFRQLEWLNF